MKGLAKQGYERRCVLRRHAAACSSQPRVKWCDVRDGKENKVTLAEWASHCGLALASNQSLVSALFLGGLAGSFTHCMGMCGPFVLAQAAARLETVPPDGVGTWTRLRGAALLPYHAGRLTTYGVLGVAAATLAVPLRGLPGFHLLAGLLLTVAALLFLLQALHLTQRILPRWLPSPRLPEFVQPWLKRLFAAPTGWRGYGLGVLLGLLPCGLIYAAILAVMAKADPLIALFGMAAFALGTMPALLLVALGGQYVTARWRPVFGYVAPILMGANAFVLFSVAGGFWR